MCVAYPGVVEKIEGDIAVVDFAGNKVRASCSMVDVKSGDRVLVHAGCILQVIRKEEAEEMEGLFEEIWKA